MIIVHDAADDAGLWTDPISLACSLSLNDASVYKREIIAQQAVLSWSDEPPTSIEVAD